MVEVMNIMATSFETSPEARWLQWTMGPRGATTHPRSGVAAERSYPTSKKHQLHGCRRAERSCSTLRVRRGDLVQGKEQWLHFTGAAMKRYSTTKVRETQVRW